MSRPTEMMARIHNAGLISRRRPATANSIACRMKPHKMPWVIESVSGMSTIVMKAGSESSTVLKSRLPTV